MENASKALIMAGSVLIAMIVISLLVALFTNLKNLQNTQLSTEQVEQATEFNKQYDVYDRNVYGSELLSLANKIKDYNIRQAEMNDYTKIELEVTFLKDIDSTLLKKGTYTHLELIQKIDDIENEINIVGNESITFITKTGVKSSRKISQLSTMRTADIEELGTEQKDYLAQVNKYNTYKTLLTEIKAKVFKSKGFEYDKNTGRVIKMKYEL